MTLRVDVILPVHRGERWVSEAIESVLRQSHPHWHLCVVDDASPDASAQRVEALARRHPGRITLLRLERAQRPAGARMAGVARTRGEVIAFLDQDDRWLPAKLERQVKRLEADASLGAVHGDVEIIDADGAPVPGAADGENAHRASIAWGAGPALAAALFRKNAIRLACAAVRRSAFEAAGGFDTALFGGEDWEFWVRFAERFPIAHLPEVLAQRRVHGANVSRAHAAERTRGKLRALEKMARAHPWLAPHVAGKRRELRGDEERPLGICLRLFARLEEAGVRYCHWKSNEHVRGALAGRTDFDLLVDPADGERFEAVLRDLDFKPVLAPPEKRFPGMRDRLGCDPESGALVHLHVHEQLVLGAPRVKNHRLPLEALLLDDVRELHGVRAPSAELELLLLAVRAPLKVSPWRLLRRWRRDGAKTLPSALLREMQFLRAGLDEERLRGVLAKSGLALDAGSVLGFVDAACGRSLSTPGIAGFRRRVLRALRPYRRAPAWRAALRGLRARALEQAAARHWLGPRGRTLPGGGRIFALVGADGSGKSTLAADLRRWLGWKLAVEGAYFGIPKDSRRYRLLQQGRRRLGSRWLDAERWVLVARRRLAEYRRAARAARRGAVVIADRWPLPALWSPPEPMDGPRLAGHGLAARERALYARIPPPAKAFVLRTDLEVLRAREGGVDPGIHARKARLVNALEESDLLALVDGNRPYADVLLDLKRRIWALL